MDRLLGAGVLSTAQEAELRDRRDRLNPAEIARDIQSLQDRLTVLARDIQSLQDRLTVLARNPTLDLQAAITTPRPDTTRGVKLRPAS